MSIVGHASEGPEKVGNPPLTLRRVELFPSGQGVYEYQSSNTADAELKLSLRRDELDDVLKSLVLKGFESARISYKPEDSLTDQIIPRLLTDSTSTRAELLQDLRGERVVVTDDKSTKHGTIVSVELQVQLTPNGKQEYEVLTLHTALGFEQIKLAPQTIVALDKSESKLAFDRAIQQSESELQNRYPVELMLKKRNLGPAGIAFQTEAAPWKCSYRVAKIQEQFQLVASAVIDNNSEVDWIDIELILVIDQPLAFRSRVSQVQRPSRESIDVPTVFSSPPPLLAAGRKTNRLGESKDKFGKKGNDDPFAGSESMPGGMGGMGVGMGGMGGMGGGMGGMGGGMGMGIGTQTNPNLQLVVNAPQESHDSNQASSPLTQRLGMSFTMDSLAKELAGKRVQLSIPNVTIRAGEAQTVFLPMVPHKIRELSVHVSSMKQKHPLAAFEVTLQDGYQLMAGPGTVWNEAGYSGDVMFPRMVANVPQLVTYSIESSLSISSKTLDQKALPSKWEIVQEGSTNAIRQTTRNERTCRYFFENDGSEPKTVLIEHTSLDANWKPEIGNGVRVGDLEEIYRYETIANAESQSTFDVLESLTETVDWKPSTSLATLEELRKRGDLPSEIQARVDSWISAHRKRKETELLIQAIEQRIKTSLETIEDCEKQQRRIQELTKPLVRGDELHTRYVNRISSLEDAIEKATEEIKAAKQERLRLAR